MLGGNVLRANWKLWPFPKKTEVGEGWNWQGILWQSPVTFPHSATLAGMCKSYWPSANAAS